MERLARIHRALSSASIQIILIRHAVARRRNLVKDAILWRRVAAQVHVVEERRDGVVGDVVGGELLHRVLRAAGEDGDVAVGAGVGRHARL